MENDGRQNFNTQFNFNILFHEIFKKKLLITVVTLIFAILSVLVSLQIPNKYKSSSLLSVVESKDGMQSALSGLTSQYGGLASMAGVTLPGSEGSDKSYLVINTIKSRTFLKHLIETDPSILQNIMAYESYDAKSKTITYDYDKYNSIKKEWVREPTKYHKSKPSYLELHELFDKKVLQVTLDKITGLIKISITTVSPEYSKSLLELIINELNITERKKDMDKSSKALSYLEQIYIKTSQENIKKSINNLIESQLKIQMLANLQEDYLLSIIDPPFIPELKDSPSRAMICIFGTFIGFLLSILLVLTNFFIRIRN